MGAAGRSERGAQESSFAASDSDASTRDASTRDASFHGRTAAVLGAFLLLAIAMLALNVCVGSVEVPMGDLARILAEGPSAQGTAASVVWQIRLPRALAAAVAGAALATSGFLLQTFFDNPIASPYILGVSSGAKLAVAVAMILVGGAGRAMGPGELVGAAFLGALATMAFVLAVAQRMRSVPLLIVAGVMVGYLCSAATDFLVAFADDQSIVNLHNWGLGSFSATGWGDVAVMAACVVPGLLGALAMVKPMGAFQLGESHAMSVGVNLRLFRIALIGVASLLAAAVTAFAGPVSFVGVAVPHIARMALGSVRPTRVVPACILGGSAFCLLCDLIARTAFAPVELSVSAVTAVFGAPVVIGLLLRRKGGRR